MQLALLQVAANALASRASSSRGAGVASTRCITQSSPSRRGGVAVFASQAAADEQTFRPYNKNAYLRQPSEAFEYTKDILTDLSDVTLRVRFYIVPTCPLLIEARGARRLPVTGKWNPELKRRSS